MDSSGELVLLWRALLLASGSRFDATEAMTAAIDACRPWSDRPGRLEIWLAGFAALDEQQQRTDIHLVDEPLTGPQATDIRAVADFLEGSTSTRRLLLLGRHLGRLSSEELARFVADRSDDDHPDPTRIDEWVEHDTRVAAQALSVHPADWSRILVGVVPPTEPIQLVYRDVRARRTWATVGGLAAMALLFIILFSVGRGPAPQSESSAPAGADTAGPAEAVGPTTTLDGGPVCVNPDVAGRILVSPIYQERLRARTFAEVLEASDLVVRGDVESLDLEGGGIRFVLADEQVLFGEGSAPDSFFFNARFDATGGPIPNGTLFRDVLVFLDRDGDRWTVSEEGGFWIECGGAPAIPVGADWPTGAGWPPRPSPTELAGAIGRTLREDIRFVMVPEDEWTVGGFPLPDGRTLILQLPSGMQPDGPMEGQVSPAPSVLAAIGGPDVRIVLREESCDPETQIRSPLVVCASDGATTIEIASALNLSQAWLDRMDVFLLGGGSPTGGSSGDAAGEVSEIERFRVTRGGLLVAIDPAAGTIIWRAGLRTGETLAGVGATTVAVLADGNLRVLDRVTGSEQFGQKVDPTVGVVPSGDDWIVAAPDEEPPVVQLVAGRTGGVRWSVTVEAAARIQRVTDSVAIIELDAGGQVAVALADGSVQTP